MKLKVFLLLNLALQSNLIFAQSNEVRFLIDTTVSIMKKNAVNANTVNWDILKKNALIQASTINDPFKLGPIIRSLYKSINDFHGSFTYKDSTFQWRHNSPVVSDSMTNEFRKGVKVQTKLLENNIGYLRVPSMPARDYNKNAQNLNDSLCSLLSKGIKGIVLDLRLNGGGAMFPMILGLKPLLPQGKIGAFQTQKKENWIIKENSFFIDTALITKINPSCTINALDIPIVMLTSPITGSSAEFLIVSFKGRKNTILLGSKTAGYVTINTGFSINDYTSMLLSTGYGLDRSGKSYKEAIDPDIPFVSIDKFNNLKIDEKVEAAVKWIKDQTK